jgi:hypothetical protein
MTDEWGMRIDFWRVSPSGACGAVGAMRGISPPRRGRRLGWVLPVMSEGRVLVGPRFLLGIITELVIAAQFSGVVVLQDASDLLQELDERSGGLVGEISGQDDAGVVIGVHSACPGQGLISSRAASTCSRVACWALASAAADSV